MLLACHLCRAVEVWFSSAIPAQRVDFVVVCMVNDGSFQASLSDHAEAVAALSCIPYGTDGGLAKPVTPNDHRNSPYGATKGECMCAHEQAAENLRRQNEFSVLASMVVFFVSRVTHPSFSSYRTSAVFLLM